MAGRFVSQKLTSAMSRSRSVLGAHASAAASAAPRPPVLRHVRNPSAWGLVGPDEWEVMLLSAKLYPSDPVMLLSRMNGETSIGTLSNPFNGAAPNLGTKVANSPVHGYEASVGTLGNLFHGAAGHPCTVFPGNCGIHGYAARYFNTMPCSRAAAKTCWPALVDSAGVRRSFSSKISWDAEPEARMAAYIAELEAERAAWKAKEEVKRAAWEAKATDWLTKLKSETKGFRNYMSFLGLVWTFNFFCWFSPAPKQEEV